MSNVSRGGLNRFVVTVDTVRNGVKKALMPSMARTTSDGTWCNGIEPVTCCCSDTGSNVSQRVQAVNSSPVPPACWSTAAVDVDEDWPEEWDYDWESDWMEEWPEDWFWHNPEEYTSEWHDGESSYLVC